MKHKVVKLTRCMRQKRRTMLFAFDGYAAITDEYAKQYHIDNPSVPKRCAGCAFRRGTEANRHQETMEYAIDSARWHYPGLGCHYPGRAGDLCTGVLIWRSYNPLKIIRELTFLEQLYDMGVGQ
jgi:hypothetical protein